MMHVLITGGTGLLGEEIFSFCDTACSLSSADIDLTKENIDSFLSKRCYDVVIHCAAKVGGVSANTKFVADFFDDNMKINMNVVESCKKHNVKLVSVLSTCIYPAQEYVTYPITENQLHNGPPHPSNFGYAYAKRMLEVQTRAYRNQYQCNFINVIPNNLYGPHDNYDSLNGHVIPSLIKRFYEAKIRNDRYVVVWGDGKPEREFTFAKDAASIILWLAKNYDGTMPVNIGNTEQTTIYELAYLISEIVGYTGEIKFDKTFPNGQLKKPTSNEFLRKLGYDFKYTSLKDGLKETVSFFEENYPNLRGIKKV